MKANGKRPFTADAVSGDGLDNDRRCARRAGCLGNLLQGQKGS
jgi:hypothetical protein